MAAIKQILFPRTTFVAWMMICVLLAGLGAFFPGQGLLMGLAAWSPVALLSIWYCQRLDRSRAIGLVEIFCFAVSVRWMVATLVHLFVYDTRPGLFASDELEYEYQAKFVVAWFDGQIPQLPADAYTMGTVWIMGACYWLFGEGPLNPKLFHGLGGAWTAIFTALIAHRFGPPAVARRAGMLAAIFPSLVLFSTLQVKDGWALFGVELGMLGFLLLRDRLTPQRGALMVGGLLVASSVRPYEMVFVLAAATASLLFLPGRRGRLRNLALFAALAVVLNYASRDAGEALGSPEMSTIERVNFTRIGYSDTAGSALNVSLVDTTTPLGLLLWMPIGLAYFYLGPLPFTTNTIISNATAPEMLWWYTLLPAIWRGGRFLLRSGHIRELVPLFLYALLASISWSTVSVNMGTLYRYRAQVLFVPLVLIAVDQTRRAAARQAAWQLSDTRLHPPSAQPVSS